jgi:hypothetical protein
MGGVRVVQSWTNESAELPERWTGLGKEGEGKEAEVTDCKPRFDLRRWDLPYKVGQHEWCLSGLD